MEKLGNNKSENITINKSSNNKNISNTEDTNSTSLNKLAPILTFSSSSEEPHDPTQNSVVHKNSRNNATSNDKHPFGVEEFLSRAEQMKSMISRSCMTSRETSDLENHLSALNNFEHNFQCNLFISILLFVWYLT